MPAEPKLTAGIWESIGVPNKDEKPTKQEQPPVVVLSLSELLQLQEVQEIRRLLKPKVVTGPVSRVFTNQPVAYSGTDKDQDVQEYNCVHVDVLVSGTTPRATLTLYSVPFGPGDAIAIALSDPAASRVITANESFDCPVGSSYLRVGLSDVSGTFADGQGYTLIVTPYNHGGTANSLSEQRYVSASYSTAQTATTIKSGPGVLHSVSVLGGTLGAITVWDSLSGSGTVILPAFTPSVLRVPASIIVDVVFLVGLTVTTAAATVIQFSYR